MIPAVKEGILVAAGAGLLPKSVGQKSESPVLSLSMIWSASGDITKSANFFAASCWNFEAFPSIARHEGSTVVFERYVTSGVRPATGAALYLAAVVIPAED